MMDDFIVNKDKATRTGFVPEIVEEIGYGVKTGLDEEGKRGLIPIPTMSQVGVSGQERIEDNPDCYAKAIKYENDADYVCMIRADSRGQLIDPWSSITSLSSNARKARQTGKSEYYFSRVAKEVFMSYLQYLTTRNGSHLRLAERKYKDG